MSQNRETFSPKSPTSLRPEAKQTGPEGATKSGLHCNDVTISRNGETTPRTAGISRKNTPTGS